MLLTATMKGLRDGGVYTTGDGMVVVVCSDDAGGYIIYVLEEARRTKPAVGEPVEDRRKFVLFTADRQGRLSRFGRPTGWSVADLDLMDTGQTEHAR